jgi:hypothetical protein
MCSQGGGVRWALDNRQAAIRERSRGEDSYMAENLPGKSPELACAPDGDVSGFVPDTITRFLCRKFVDKARFRCNNKINGFAYRPPWGDRS